MSILEAISNAMNVGDMRQWERVRTELEKERRWVDGEKVRGQHDTGPPYMHFWPHIAASHFRLLDTAVFGHAHAALTCEICDVGYLS